MRICFKKKLSATRVQIATAVEGIASPSDGIAPEEAPASVDGVRVGLAMLCHVSP